MSVPQGAGIEGLIETITSIINTVKVDKIVIHSNGELLVDWHTQENDVPEDASTVDEAVKLPSVILKSPADILSRVELEELPVKETPERTLITMFSRMQANGYIPTAFVAGEDDGTLHKWLSPFFAPSAEEGIYSYLLGLRIYFEPKFPSDALILCGSPAPNAELKDVTIAYKISMEVP